MPASSSESKRESSSEPSAGEASAERGTASAALPGPSRVRAAIGWLQLALAAPLFAIGWLTVVVVPTDALWMPAIGATEWGHLLALAPVLVLLLPGWRSRAGKAGAALAVAAALLLLSPLLRARSVAADLPARVTAAFGDAAPRALPGAPARSGPLVDEDLLGLPASDGAHVAVTRHVYREVAGERLPLDLYLRPDAPAPRPIVVVLHGGAWRGGSLTQLPAIDRYLAARGYAVAAVGYRLAPRHPFPAAHDDVLAAVAWLQAQAGPLGLDPTRVVLLGRSAGGHLALLAAYRSGDPAIRGVVAYYPPTDMVWSWEHPSNPRVFDSPGALREFLGGDPASRPDAYRDASPLGFVGPTSPPTLLIHGGRDAIVYHRQSERLAEALERAHVPHLLLSLPWANHGCDANLAGPSGQLGTYAIERFLATVLR